MLELAAIAALMSTSACTGGGEGFAQEQTRGRGAGQPPAVPVTAATVVQKPFQFGYLSSKWMHELATKGPTAKAALPPTHIIDTGVEVIRKENVADFMPLVREAAAEGDRHFGVVFTSPRSMPRALGTIGLSVERLDSFVGDRPNADALADQVQWLGSNVQGNRASA